MKKLILTHFVLIALLLGSNSCRRGWPCIRGSGDVVQEFRSVGSFNKINSTGSFNVYIIQDSISQVTVEAHESLLTYIATNINNDELTIKERNNHCIENSGSINIYVRTPNDISEVRLSGSGLIYSDSIQTSTIDIKLSGSGKIDLLLDATTVNTNISGSGDIVLAGSAVEGDFKISGSGDISALNLLLNNCFANISGSGKIYVNVNQLLDVKISGSGSVYYLGNPTINTNISGSGKVVKY